MLACVFSERSDLVGAPSRASDQSRGQIAGESRIVPRMFAARCVLRAITSTGAMMMVFICTHSPSRWDLSLSRVVSGHSRGKNALSGCARPGHLLSGQHSLVMSDSPRAWEDMHTLHPCVAENEGEGGLLEVGSVQPTSGLEGFQTESA